MTAKRPAPRTAFRPGQSGNPSGRPKIPGDVIELARAHTPLAISTLANIVRSDETPPAARVAASVALLDRAWGKPVQAIQTSGTSNLQLHLVAAQMVSRQLLEGVAERPPVSVIKTGDESDGDDLLEWTPALE